MFGICFSLNENLLNHLPKNIKPEAQKMMERMKINLLILLEKKKRESLLVQKCKRI